MQQELNLNIFQFKNRLGIIKTKKQKAQGIKRKGQTETMAKESEVSVILLQSTVKNAHHNGLIEVECTIKKLTRSTSSLVIKNVSSILAAVQKPFFFRSLKRFVRCCVAKVQPPGGMRSQSFQKARRARFSFAAVCGTQVFCPKLPNVKLLQVQKGLSAHLFVRKKKFMTRC